MSSLNLNNSKPNQVSPKVSSQAPSLIDYSNPENDPGLLDESELLDEAEEVEDLESEIESEIESESSDVPDAIAESPEVPKDYESLFFTYWMNEISSMTDSDLAVEVSGYYSKLIQFLKNIELVNSQGLPPQFISVEEYYMNRYGRFFYSLNGLDSSTHKAKARFYAEFNPYQEAGKEINPVDVHRLDADFNSFLTRVRLTAANEAKAWALVERTVKRDNISKNKNSVHTPYTRKELEDLAWYYINNYASLIP
jgi:hypothetical protein